MKRKILGLLLILLMPVLVVNAKSSNYFEADENLSVDGEVNHSKFVAGNNLDVRANIKGLGFLAGNVVNVSGSQEYGFYAGESINVRGIVSKDLFVAGNNIRIEKDANIGRDLYAAGSNVRMEGIVSGNLFVAAGTLVLDNVNIEGNVDLNAGKLDIIGDVRINGTLYVNEDAEINNENNLVVSKKETYKDNSVSINIDFKSSIIDVLIKVLTLVFTGIILALIFPKLFTSIDKELSVSKVFKLMLIGLISLILIPVLAVITLFTIVGVNIGLMLFFIYVIGIMLATILSSYLIGYYIYTKLLKKNDNLYLDIVIGVLVVEIFSLIPIINTLTGLIVFLTGFGIVFKLIKEKCRN